MNTTRDLEGLIARPLRPRDIKTLRPWARDQHGRATSRPLAWWRTRPPAKARIRRMYAAQWSARAIPADPRAMRSVAETACFQANLRNCATCPFRGVLRTVARDSGVCLRALGCDPALRGSLGICMQRLV